MMIYYYRDSKMLTMKNNNVLRQGLNKGGKLGSIKIFDDDKQPDGTN